MDELPEAEGRDMEQENLEFMELLKSMDEKYRTLLILYYVEGFNTREIAELLELNEHTVKTRLVRARRSFAKEYQGENIIVGGRTYERI